jgi:hypothetical protein
MNNIKIKSYSLKRKTSDIGATKTNNAESRNFLFSDRKTENEEKNINNNKPILENLQNNLIHQINKMIKSPSSNLSSKPHGNKQSKGNLKI